VKLVDDIIFATSFATGASTLLAAGRGDLAYRRDACALWVGDLARGGVAARARGHGRPALIVPETTTRTTLPPAGAQGRVDYLQFSFNTAMAFSTTDISAVRQWAKLVMLAEAAISVVVAILVIARAVNILNDDLAPNRRAHAMP
jgi:hypothetical protein